MLAGRTQLRLSGALQPVVRQMSLGLCLWYSRVMQRVWEYIRAFGSDWVTLMGGVGALLFTAVGTIWSVPPWVFWGIGAVLFIVSSFRVWLNERKTIEKLQEQIRTVEKGSSPLSGLFVIEQIKWEFGVRAQNGGFGWLAPDHPKPKAGTLILQIMVHIDARPARVVEDVELDLMGKRLPSDWKSSRISPEYQQFNYFNIPSWANPGIHKVKLVAKDSKTEVSSPEFEIDIPQQA